MKKTIIFLALTLTACGSGDDAATTSGLPRGVTADTITIGSHTDLSGGLAVWGVAMINGIRMRFEDVNAAGGIHGRKIEFVVEDNQYQVPMAVKATNKLINVDKIFLMLASMGTPHNNAVFNRMFAANVPSLFPLTASVSMYEPLHPLKFSYFVSYRDQVRGAIAHMVENNDISKVCLQSAANDYGQEVVIGFEQAVDEHGLEVVYEGRHKGSETDYTGTVTGIKNSGCELLFMGPFIKDAILIYTAARDAGFDAPIVANMVPYLPEVAQAADGGMDGFYAAASFRLPDYETELEADSWVGEWYERYVETFGSEPGAQSTIGWVIADLTVRAIEAAGPDITTDKVIAGLEAINNYQDPFGGPSLSFSAEKHQGGDYLNLYQVQGGKWQTVAEGIPY